MTPAECNEFKQLLKEKVVKFEFLKRDGTVRKAEGTLAKSIVPEVPEEVTYKCTNIQWDCDNDEELERLPKKATVKLDAKLASELTDEGIEDKLGDALEAEFEFCFHSFEYVKLEKRAAKKLPEGTIFYYDTERKGFRSFNESQLISFTKENGGN